MNYMNSLCFFICGLYLTDCDNDCELEKVRVAELSVGDISVAPARSTQRTFFRKIDYTMS